MKIKHIATALILVFVSTMTLPVLAQGGAPQTPADCMSTYAGDAAAIQACIDRLKQ